MERIKIIVILAHGKSPNKLKHRKQKEKALSKPASISGRRVRNLKMSGPHEINYSVLQNYPSVFTSYRRTFDFYTEDG